jgi:DNA polymerase III sliding clamp (beta) subunit (PCNA family)
MTNENAAIVVDRKYALDLITGEDQNNGYQMSCVCADKGRACASNGRILAVVPCEGTNGHVVLIPSALFGKARRGKRFQETCIVEDVAGGNLRAETKEGIMSVSIPEKPKYPDVDAVFPTESKREVSVALNAELLADLQKALGGKSVVLHFTIFEHRNKPECIRVTVPGDNKAKGAIMPMSVFE